MGNHDPLRAFLSLLKDVKATGTDQWIARCPGHQDAHASLGVGRGNDGRVLLNCYAGCDPEKIVRAVGLEMTDLFVDQRQESPEIAWAVRDADGNTIAVHKRIDKPEGKVIWWERDGVKGLRGLKVGDLPLYGTERLKALKDGTTVVLCEGEKAADAVRAVGLEGIGTACGASATPSPAVLAHLVRFKIILWPDNDDVGRKHMERIAQRLKGASIAWVAWPDAPDKGDAADTTASHIKALVQSAQVADSQSIVAQEPPEQIASSQTEDSSRAAFLQSIVASLEEPMVSVAGTTIRMTWPTMNLRFIAKSVRESNGKIDCKFRVEGNIPGVPGSVLHSAHLSVLSTSSRQDAERALRRAVDGIDWWPFILKFCNAVEDALDYGQPIERIRSSDKKAPGVSYIIRPLVTAGLPMALYADRGMGKSYVAALLVALALHPEYASVLNLSAEIPAAGVLWLDWEADRNTLLGRVQQLQEGLEMPNDLDFNYLSCTRPLAGEVERLKTDLPAEARQFVVIDSLGAAAGGDLNKPEPALAFFRALRELGGSAIVIAQTSKGLDGGRSIYGSAFYEYYFRNIWSANAVEDRAAQELHVGLFNTKNNYDRLSEPVGLRFCFAGSSVKVYPCSAEGLRTDKGPMDIKSQLTDFLRVAGKPVDLSDLKRAFPDIKPSTITGTISKLCRDDVAVLLERGRYAARAQGGDDEIRF